MKLKGKHSFAIVLFLIGVAFTLYVTMPAAHQDHSGLSCPVNGKDTAHKTEKVINNGSGN